MSLWKNGTTIVQTHIMWVQYNSNKKHETLSNEKPDLCEEKKNY